MFAFAEKEGVNSTEGIITTITIIKILIIIAISTMLMTRKTVVGL
jgi:hypothetical protein